MTKKYSLELVFLENCPHSMEALSLFQNNNIEHIFTSTTYDKKNIHTQGAIKTFPQIYLNYNKEHILIGGNDKFQEIYKILTNVTPDNLSDQVDNVMKNYGIKKKKTVLKLVEIFNIK